MSIPFLGVFQRLKSRLRPPAETAPVAPERAAPLEKPSSEKLSKTVLPNTTRVLAPLDPFQVAAGASPARPSRPAQPTRSPGLPPVVLLALEPKVERTIALQLGDFIEKIPAGYLKAAENLDPERRVLLKASEVEKGMAKGKPTIPLTSIYEQMPEIFVKTVPATELMHLPLPVEKVLEQFSTMRVRSDQERDQTVPQVETPILQATLEDSERFGMPMEPLQTCALPSVRVQPASARALAEAEPETAIRAPGPATPLKPAIPLSAPLTVGTEPPQSPTAEPPTPARIPFHLPPNGTGESASEKVPASSGPPVPTRLPISPSRPQSPFKVSPPSDDLRPKLRLVPGAEQAEAHDPDEFALPSKPAKQDDVKIALPLQAILQNIPAFQLSGSPDAVPATERIEFPMSLIQPQLAAGRVAVPPKTFQAAMPAQFRQLIVIDAAETPIMLALHEVLKNLPGAALQMRADQEEAEKGIAFETPFSLKAKEDAERFKVSDAPIAKPTEPVAAESEASKPDGEKIDIAPPVEEEENLDAKAVVARANALAGVAGCSVTFADGLMLAGNLPGEMAVEGLCAMAPSLLQRIEQHMLNTKLGALNAMTLHGNKSAVTFFMQGNICLTALHGAAELGAETQTELAVMAKKLSRTYAQPETAHVDH